jgi:hypothetical protein
MVHIHIVAYLARAGLPMSTVGLALSIFERPRVILDNILGAHLAYCGQEEPIDPEAMFIFFQKGCCSTGMSHAREENQHIELWGLSSVAQPKMRDTVQSQLMTEDVKIGLEHRQ